MLSRATSMTDRQRRGAVLRVMLLSLMLVVSAVASLNVALPDIARDTGASQSELQWIVDAYALVFAALLLPAGAIGDRFGRKTLLAVGLGIYGGPSAVALFASTSCQLLGLRSLVGLAAALTKPVTLSVVTSVFPPEERGKAVGTWVGVAAGGAVVGLLASGLLLEFFSGSRSSRSTSCSRPQRWWERLRSSRPHAKRQPCDSTRSVCCFRSPLSALSF